MEKNLTIIDKDYLQWVKELALRYRQSQIKAAVKVNTEKLLYNWQLGHDIVEMHVEDRWGEKVITQLSKDLQQVLPGVEGLSRSNIYYCKKFYLLYSQRDKIVPQVVGRLDTQEISPQLGEQMPVNIFAIPWGHHKLLIDKFKNAPYKALFYVRKTIENGWSCAQLGNHWLPNYKSEKMK